MARKQPLSTSNGTAPDIRGQLLGYARISSKDQTIDHQIDAFEALGCTRIFSDVASGSKSDRPGRRELLEYVRTGDIIVVFKLDRFGRNLRDLVEQLDTLSKRGIFFRSLSEGLDTSTPAGRLQTHMLAALAEYIRDIIVEQTNLGLAAARKRGRKGGRRSILNNKQLEMICKLANSGTPIKELCEQFGISKTTFYRIIDGPGIRSWGEHEKINYTIRERNGTA